MNSGKITIKFGLFAIFLTLNTSEIPASGLYKCVSQSGTVEYRDTACHKGHSASEVKIGKLVVPDEDADVRYRRLIQAGERYDHKQQQWTQRRNQAWRQEREQKERIALERMRLCDKAERDLAKYQAQLDKARSRKSRNAAKHSRSLAEERTRKYCDS